MHRCIRIVSVVILLYFLFPLSVVNAQTLQLKSNAENDLQQAIEMYQSNRFLAAQQILSALQNQEVSSGMKRDVDFYSALTALKLDTKDAFYQAEKFKKNHSVYSNMSILDLLLADYQFDHRRYAPAIPLYESIQVGGLSQEDKDRLNFRLGYCYFFTEKWDKATAYLFKAKESKSKYAPAATYYYGHIAYQEKNYTTALRSFKQIENSPMFKDIVPYYIVQIAFKQEKYQQVANEAPALYKSVSSARKPEIAQILGVSLFKLESYASAIEYLEYYRQAKGTDFSRSDYYQLAYAYMKGSEFQQAIKYFEKVKIEDDALSQNAFYNVGACYLQMGQKQFAGEAFYRAYQLPFDKKLQEDAMFNFAKVSYELSNDPYNKAIKALLAFITDFPTSDRIGEANEYLVNLFVSAKNYKGALEELELIPNKNQQLLAAYQKITFNRAVELIRERNYKNAIDLLKKSTTYNYDKLTRINAQYWMAETQYQMGDYKAALSVWEELKRNGFSRQLEKYALLDYNIGYAYFQLDNYEKAGAAFSQFVQKVDKTEPRMVDANLRIADIYFIQKEFKQAITYYENAEKLSAAYQPYAVYQKAQALGGEGDLNAKIEVLKAFTQTNRDFDLSDDAFAELGTTYLLTGQESAAIQTFTALMQRFPNSPFYRTALLKMGMAYYNLDNRSEALASLKKVVERFPGTQESKEALVSIRNIYVESNEADAFFVYVKDLPDARVSSTAQDTIMYRASENVYMNGDCRSAIPGFTDYIDKFPSGAFAVNAHFYRAECLLKANLLRQAADDYKEVANVPNSVFYESAVSKLSYLYRNEKKFDLALRMYTRLYEIASSDKNRMIARDGQLESYYQLNMPDSIMWVAQQILRSPDADEQSYKRAHLYLAKAAFQSDQIALAQREYKIVEGLLGGSASAEAKYHLALIQFQIGDYKLAEKMIFELLNDYASYDYWIAKGFILLADIYVKYGNTFQAKHTLQSIIDNQTDTELIQIALEKKQAIIELEYLQELEKQKEIVPADSISAGNTNDYK
ncbi:MAG: tetratricopeptide repeat protein [Bacteroidales bacterium]|nr:tetratricopeptide repeat protein [Bacteroidales bacterium]